MNSFRLVRRCGAAHPIRSFGRTARSLKNRARFSISQIEEIGFDLFWQRKDELAWRSNELAREQTTRFSALLVTDIASNGSLLLMSREPDGWEEINYPQLEDKLYQARRGGQSQETTAATDHQPARIDTGSLAVNRLPGRESGDLRFRQIDGHDLPVVADVGCTMGIGGMAPDDRATESTRKSVRRHGIALSLRSRLRSVFAIRRSPDSLIRK